MQDEDEMPSQQNVVHLNDSNNNSNQFEADFGPETDVDTIDADEVSEEITAGDKEKGQCETKETEDMPDRGNPFGVDNSAIFGSLENKIFEELSLHNPDLMKGNNPFAAEGELDDTIPNEFIDNKLMDDMMHNDDFGEETQEMHKEVNFSEKKEFSIDYDDLGKVVDEQEQQELAAALNQLEDTENKPVEQVQGEFPIFITLFLSQLIFVEVFTYWRLNETRLEFFPIIINIFF